MSTKKQKPLTTPKTWTRSRRPNYELKPIKGDEETPFIGVCGTFMMFVQSIEELWNEGSGFIVVRGLILTGFHFNDRGNYEPGQTVTIGPITDSWRRLIPLKA